MPQWTPEPFGSLLAHQLKSPTSVLGSTAVNLRRSLVSLIEDIAALGGASSGSHGDQAGAREALARCATVISEPAFIPTGLDEPGRIEAIIARLRALGVEGDLGMAASSLLRGGWGDRIDSLAPLLVKDPQRGLGILEGLARLRNGVASIEAAADRMARLARALGALSDPDVDGMTDPVTSLRSVVTQMEASLPPGVALTLETCSAPQVRGRDDLLAEIWSNLITNAVEAVGAVESVGGRGRVAVRMRVVRGAEARVIVSVTNDGPPIVREELDRMFEPRVTTKEASGSRGLGLPIARALLERIGGEVTASSDGEGTTFEVGLPAERAAAAHGAGS